MTLVEFLTARLNEDQVRANAVPPGPWTWVDIEEDGSQNLVGSDGRFVLASSDASGYWSWIVRAPGLDEYLKTIEPENTLREVEAKRRIIDRYVELRDRCAVAWSDYSDWLEGKPGAGNAPGVSSHDPAIRDELEQVLRDLASAYAGHGDYQEAWRV